MGKSRPIGVPLHGLDIIRRDRRSGSAAWLFRSGVQRGMLPSSWRRCRGLAGTDSKVEAELRKRRGETESCNGHLEGNMEQLYVVVRVSQ